MEWDTFSCHTLNNLPLSLLFRLDSVFNASSSSFFWGVCLQGAPGERGPMGFPGVTVRVHDRITKCLLQNILGSTVL